jgi:predicted ribosome quality control (RQC) complex YloA/Tae2 family protein
VSLRASEALPLARWLEERLAGAALQGIRLPEARTVVLELRRPGESVRLLIAAERGRCRFHTVARAPANPRAPFALQGLLRKELRGVLTGLEMPHGDRILRLAFPGRTLVALLYDAAADLLLLDEEDRVLGSTGAHARGSTYECPAPPVGAPRHDRFEGVEGADRDAAIRAWFEGDELDRVRAALRRTLSRRRRSVARRVQRQEEESDRAGQADALSREADLLQGAFGRLRRGMDSIEVPDWYEGGVRRIELEPARDGPGNVERLYNRARRARRAGEEAGRRLLESLEELEGLDARLEALEGASLDELRAIAPAKPARRPAAAATARRLPYRVYRSRGGLELRVGRGARDNDDLTFRHSKGNDVWLHVRGRPGAHVVVRAPGTAPPPELLLEAAQLALHHSGCKPGAREEVLWTRVKQVRKPKGMKPGAVLPGGGKTLLVDYDPTVIDSLKSD